MPKHWMQWDADREAERILKDREGDKAPTKEELAGWLLAFAVRMVENAENDAAWKP